ncbi:MAG: ABC transporter ATP-binding protein [Methanoregula sp.]|nr:ABC transporter ATP-binding protein [Methanoregula sp.]
MSDVVIRVENLCKEYRLGKIGRGTLSRDLQSVWAKFQGKEDPNAKIDSINLSQMTHHNSLFCALKNISFDVHEGEIIGIIGHNGAGKSTLLKIISRVTAPTKGTIKIKGRVASLLEVGTGFHPELSGRENVFLNGAILGMHMVEIEQKFEEIIKFSEIERFIDTPVKRYSSGMYVRLAFAVAAHLDPEILLVDEVLAVGDAAFQKKCLGKMGEVARQGRTVLFVSHNMSAIKNLTHTCIHLSHGEIFEICDTETVVKNYLSHIDAAIKNTGFANLDQAPHVAGSRQFARLLWVEITNSCDIQAQTFLKGEPFKIIIGFEVNERISNVEIACNIRTIDNGTSLIMSPSGQREMHLPQGRYQISMTVDPNFLTEGDYNIGLYIFIGGRKEDVVSPAINFSISCTSIKNENPFNLTWGTGFFYQNYAWGEITNSIGDIS